MRTRFRSVGGLFDLPAEPELRCLADVDEATARRSADALGFARSTGDWRRLTGDPEIDIVAITAPNALHAEMAFAAIEAGKAVYCEKPLSVDTASARSMRDAAAAAGACTMVGFAYLRNPMLRLAREIVGSGELGRWSRFAASMPRTTWPTRPPRTPSAPTPRAAAPSPISGATSLPSRAISSDRLPP